MEFLRQKTCTIFISKSIEECNFDYYERMDMMGQTHRERHRGGKRRIHRQLVAESISSLECVRFFSTVIITSSEGKKIDDGDDHEAE